MSEKVQSMATTHTPSVESLQDRLDSLWEKQLILLDQYDQAQKQLQKHMSSGFFSLAQAGFKSPSRIRYGQDYYDQRMQAARRCRLEPDGQDCTRVSIMSVEKQRKPIVEKQEIKHVEKQRTQDVPKKDSGADDEKADVQMPTPPATPLRQTDEPNAQSYTHPGEAHTVEHTGYHNDKEHIEEKPKKPTDPLHWYGILIPPQLRQSQQSFVHAVDGPLSEAANAAQGMRRIEVDIRKLRKEIRKAEKKSTL